MNQGQTGAIFYTSKYGSTARYAEWISEATGLPTFDVKATHVDPSAYDFVVVGSPIIYFKLWLHKWAKRNQRALQSRPCVLFSVSGAGPGLKLDSWIANCLPQDLVNHVEHVALRGRQDPRVLSRFDRMMLIIGSLMNRDPQARKQERRGFDFVNKSSIAPIVTKIRELQRGSMGSAIGAPRAQRQKAVLNPFP